MLFIMAIAMVSVTACGSDDDDEPGKITLGDGQDTTITLPADASDGAIRFNAVASWSAWTDSNPSRSPGDIDWIILNDTHGNAGEITLNFSLTQNITGDERSGFIVVVCEDSQLIFKVVQPASEDGDIPESLGSGHIEIVKTSYDTGANGIEPDGVTLYMLTYEGEWLKSMVCKYRDDIDRGPNQPGDDYCEVVETTTFDYNFIDGKARAIISQVSTYSPSGREERETSEHEIQFADHRAISGWYWWKDEDPVRSDFDFAYTSDGYLATSRNNDGSSTYDTSTFTWQAGNLIKISSTTGSQVSLTYSDTGLKNYYSTFDLNWALPNEIEGYDFASGDITRMWGVAGFLGKPSALLATEVREDVDDPYSCRISYSKVTPEETKAKVMYFVNGVQRRYSDWEIKYYGKIY